MNWYYFFAKCVIEFTNEAILAQINVLNFHLKNLNRNKHKPREKIKTKAQKKLLKNKNQWHYKQTIKDV